MDFVSVTEALAPFQDFSKISPETLTRATERGKWIHAAAAALAIGFYVPPVPPQYAGYVLSFKNWFRLNVKKVIAVERTFTDPVRKIIGRPDLICILIDQTDADVIDHKTPIAEGPTWCAQCAAYLNLVNLNGITVRRSGSLRLDPLGNPAKMNWYEGREAADYAAFLNALNAYRYFKVA